MSRLVGDGAIGVGRGVGSAGEIRPVEGGGRGGGPVIGARPVTGLGSGISAGNGAAVGMGPGGPVSGGGAWADGGTTVEFVQREVEVAPPPALAAPAAEPAAAPAPAPPEAEPTGAAPPSGAQAEPEELLKKLYDPLVRRLKAELWLDRERRGALTDRWR